MLIWRLSITGIHIYRNVGEGGASASREREEAEAEEGTRIRSRYLHPAHNIYDGMSRLSRDNWL